MHTQEDLIETFMREIDDREQQKLRMSQEERHIASRKYAELAPIRSLLEKFIEMGLRVHHSEKYSHAARKTLGQGQEEGQAFTIYEVDSSASWAPGISIWFDHPAQVEIAIPNKREDGVVIIKVASEHPDAYLLEKHFSDMASACEALTRFLAKNTLRVQKDPRKMQDARTSTPPVGLLAGAPTAPPASAKIHETLGQAGENRGNKVAAAKPMTLKSLDTLIKKTPQDTEKQGKIE